MTTATKTLGGREHPSPVLAPSGLIAELKARRIELGLSRTQVGACVYRSHWAVREWESGRASPPAGLLAEWAGALGFELGLYEKPVTPQGQGSPATGLLTELIGVLARALLEQDDD